MKQRNPSVLAVALAGSAALAIESTKMVVATTAGFPAHPCSPLGFAQIPLGGISSFRRERQQAHTRAIQLSYHSSPQGVSRTWVGQQHQLRHRQSRVTIEGSRVVRECVQMSLVAGADSEPNATTTPAHAGRHSTHAADTKTLESNAANEARRIRRMDVAVRYYTNRHQFFIFWRVAQCSLRVDVGFDERCRSGISRGTRSSLLTFEASISPPDTCDLGISRVHAGLKKKYTQQV